MGCFVSLLVLVQGFAKAGYGPFYSPGYGVDHHRSYGHHDAGYYGGGQGYHGGNGYHGGYSHHAYDYGHTPGFLNGLKYNRYGHGYSGYHQGYSQGYGYGHH